MHMVRCREYLINFFFFNSFEVTIIFTTKLDILNFSIGISNFFSVSLKIITKHIGTSYVYGISVCGKQQIHNSNIFKIY